MDCNVPSRGQVHIVITQCLLFTIWGRNWAGVTRFFIYISNTALNLFYTQGCGPFMYLLFISFGRLTLNNMLRVLAEVRLYLVHVSWGLWMFCCLRCSDYITHQTAGNVAFGWKNLFLGMQDIRFLTKSIMPIFFKSTHMLRVDIDIETCIDFFK